MTGTNENRDFQEVLRKTLEEAKKKKSREKDDDSDAEDEDDKEAGWSKDNKKAEKAEKDDERDDKKANKSKNRPDDEVAEEVEDDLEEETEAASSLHPAARAVKGDEKSISPSKISQLQKLLGLVSSLNKSEYTDFFDKVIGQFGPGKDYGIGDKSGSNAATLDMHPSLAVSTKGPKTKEGMPKLSVKEDVESLFEGQDLSEEFKDNVSTLFEAAVTTRVMIENTRLEEEYETALHEEVSAITEELTTKLDSYLDYVVENWMKENEVAIESTLRNELMEEFIGGLKNLFTDHYISVPQQQIDVVEALADKVNELEDRLNESITENSELKSFVTEAKLSDVFEEVSSDLTLTQKEKFEALAEGIEFDGDLDIYAKKLAIIKEHIFKKDSPTGTTNITEETFEGEISDKTVNIDPQIDRYVQALARTVKN